MTELDVLFRLALIHAMYDQKQVIARVKRLIPLVPENVRGSLAIIALAKNPKGVIQGAIDRWCKLTEEGDANNRSAR